MQDLSNHVGMGSFMENLLTASLTIWHDIRCHWREGEETVSRQDVTHLLMVVELFLWGIHSFIHSGYLYSTPSRNLLRGALSPATVKEKCLKKLAERRHVVLR